MQFLKSLKRNKNGGNDEEEENEQDSLSNPTIYLDDENIPEIKKDNIFGNMSLLT